MQKCTCCTSRDKMLSWPISDLISSEVNQLNFIDSQIGVRRFSYNLVIIKFKETINHKNSICKSVNISFERNRFWLKIDELFFLLALNCDVRTYSFLQTKQKSVGMKSILSLHLYVIASRSRHVIAQMCICSSHNCVNPICLPFSKIVRAPTHPNTLTDHDTKVPFIVYVNWNSFFLSLVANVLFYREMNQRRLSHDLINNCK